MSFIHSYSIHIIHIHRMGDLNSVHLKKFLSEPKILRLVIKIFEILEIPNKLSEQGCGDVGMPPSAVRDIWIMLHTQANLKI